MRRAIDGAGSWNRVRHITIPLLSPTIFFNLVLAVIGALQSFQGAFVATEGGPAYATWFFGLHIYKHAFDYWNMGYASALAWFFAIVIIAHDDRCSSACPASGSFTTERKEQRWPPQPMS